MICSIGACARSSSGGTVNMPLVVNQMSWSGGSQIFLGGTPVSCGFDDAIDDRWQPAAGQKYS